jgi:hypothetical protein
MIYLCCNTSLGKWFKENRGVASFVFMCNLWLSLLFQNVAIFLVDKFGWRESYFIMASGFGALFLPSVCLHRDEPAVTAKKGAGASDMGAEGVNREEAPLLGSSARVVSVGSPKSLAGRRVLGQQEGRGRAVGEKEGEEEGEGEEGEEATAAYGVSQQSRAGSKVTRQDKAEVVEEKAGGDVIASVTLEEAMRLPLFWSVLIGQCAVETAFVGSQYHIVSLLGESKAALLPAQVATAQGIAAVVGGIAGGVAGVVVDSLERRGRRYEQRLILALALLLGAGGLAILLQCYSSAAFVQPLPMLLPCLFCAAIAAMGGGSDIGTSTLYAVRCTPSHPTLSSILSSILSLCSH